MFMKILRYLKIQL